MSSPTITGQYSLTITGTKQDVKDFLTLLDDEEYQGGLCRSHYTTTGFHSRGCGNIEIYRKSLEKAYPSSDNAMKYTLLWYDKMPSVVVLSIITDYHYLTMKQLQKVTMKNTLNSLRPGHPVSKVSCPNLCEIRISPNKMMFLSNERGHVASHESLHQNQRLHLTR